MSTVLNDADLHELMLEEDEAEAPVDWDVSVDDILDVQSTEEHLGKPVGGDLRQGTVTLPTMYYLERADAEGRDAVRRVIEGDDRWGDSP